MTPWDARRSAAACGFESPSYHPRTQQIIRQRRKASNCREGHPIGWIGNLKFVIVPEAACGGLRYISRFSRLIYVGVSDLHRRYTKHAVEQRSTRRSDLGGRHPCPTGALILTCAFRKGCLCVHGKLYLGFSGLALMEAPPKPEGSMAVGVHSELASSGRVTAISSGYFATNWICQVTRVGKG